MFGEEGVNVRVNGNLTFSGDDSRLEIGGGVTTNWDVFVVMYAGTNANSLTVTGDLMLGGVSRLDIRSAATSGVGDIGSYVRVGGTMTISTNCFVYSWGDIESLSAPHFVVGSLDVQTGGVFFFNLSQVGINLVAVVQAKGGIRVGVDVIAGNDIIDIIIDRGRLLRCGRLLGSGLLCGGLR